mgnify:CR=1 FL=1
MNCNDYLPLLSGHLDGEKLGREEEQRLQAHLAQCADCRARLQAFERGDRLLRADTAVPPAGLTAPISGSRRQNTAAAGQKAMPRLLGRACHRPCRCRAGRLHSARSAEGFAQQKANDTAATAAPGDV